MNRQSRQRPASGFTLVEIIVVIALMGLVLGIGIPFFGTILHRGRVDGTAREIDLTILAARLEALKRGNAVGVAISNDPSSSIGAYNSAVVFLDVNNNGTLDLSGGTPDTVLRTDLLDPPGHHVTMRIDTPDKASPSGSAATAYFVFSPFGSLSSGGDKSVYIGDSFNNVIQIEAGTPASGKITMTKLVPGATPLYQDPPWKWM